MTRLGSYNSCVSGPGAGQIPAILASLRAAVLWSIGAAPMRMRQRNNFFVYSCKTFPADIARKPTELCNFVYNLPGRGAAGIL